MSRTTYPDSLPTREGMRTPHKNRHTPARFTARTGAGRFRPDDRMGR